MNSRVQTFTPVMTAAIGDNVTVYDPWTVHAPFMWPAAFTVIAIDDDYYTMRERKFNGTVKRIPRSYRHMRNETSEKSCPIGGGKSGAPSSDEPTADASRELITRCAPTKSEKQTGPGLSDSWEVYRKRYAALPMDHGAGNPAGSRSLPGFNDREY